MIIGNVRVGLVMQPWSLISFARLAVLLLSLGAALGACGTTHRISVADISLPASALTPLPLKMGVYYPPGLRTARNTGQLGDDKYEFSIGPGTIAAFNAATAAMFADVVPLQQLSSRGADSGALTGIIEVSEARGANSATHIGITYDVVLYGADGEKRAAWSAEGSAFAAKDLSASTRAAMRDAIASWMVGFPTQKDVKSWLEAIGGSPAPATRVSEMES